MRKLDTVDGRPVLAMAHTPAGCVVLLFICDRSFITGLIPPGGKVPIDVHRHSSRTGAVEDFRARCEDA